MSRRSGEDVVDASGAAEEADAGDGGEDCGGRRSTATECNGFSFTGTEVRTEVVATGSATAAEDSAGFAR